MNTSKTLRDECWTIGSYLRSAASKFEEIERGLFQDDRPNIRALALPFTKQKHDAALFATMFENAESVTIYTSDEET